MRDLVTDRLTDRPRTATTAVDEARQALHQPRDVPHPGRPRRDDVRRRQAAATRRRRRTRRRA
nr:hypothetical protein [Angustibacter aerolatus]